MGKLLNLSERMIEKLFPTMKTQVKFSKLLTALKQSTSQVVKDVCIANETALDLAVESSTSITKSPTDKMQWPKHYVLPKFSPSMK